jgi:hypothetical protein
MLLLPFLGLAALVVSLASCRHPPLLRGMWSTTPDEPAPPTAVIPYPYVLFKQCDPRWGQDLMVNETICSVGCLMTSCSMALHSRNIHLTNATDKVITPGTMNDWLQLHGGYDDDNDLDELALESLGQGVKYVGPIIPANLLSEDKVRAMLLGMNNIVIANVDNGGHFVLVTGFDAKQRGFFYVNDPGFPRTHYNLTQIVGWRIFSSPR